MESGPGPGQDHSRKADADGRVRRTHQAVREGRLGPVRQGTGPGRSRGPPRGDCEQRPDRLPGRRGRAGLRAPPEKARAEARAGSPQFLPHSRRPGSRTEGPSRQRQGCRGSHARGGIHPGPARQGCRGRRARRPASRPGPAVMGQRRGPVCHESPRIHREWRDPGQKSAWAGGPQCARPAHRRPRWQAPGRPLRSGRAQHHAHGRELRDQRRLRRVRPELRPGAASPRPGDVPARLRRRRQSVSARHHGAGPQARHRPRRGSVPGAGRQTASGDRALCGSPSPGPICRCSRCHARSCKTWPARNATPARRMRPRCWPCWIAARSRRRSTPAR